MLWEGFRLLEFAHETDQVWANMLPRGSLSGSILLVTAVRPSCVQRRCVYDLVKIKAISELFTDTSRAVWGQFFVIQSESSKFQRTYRNPVIATAHSLRLLVSLQLASNCIVRHRVRIRKYLQIFHSHSFGNISPLFFPLPGLFRKTKCIVITAKPLGGISVLYFPC